MEVVWTRRAFQRLIEIEVFIARENPVAAQTHTHRLLLEADKLGDFPKLGRLAPEFPASGLRELVISNYRIVYRTHNETIQILTIFESHRLFPEQDTLRGEWESSEDEETYQDL